MCLTYISVTYFLYLHCQMCGSCAAHLMSQNVQGTLFLYTTKDDNKLWLSQYHIVHNNHAKTLISFSVFTSCDEWGGAESRGNGVRPVE